MNRKDFLKQLQEIPDDYKRRAQAAAADPALRDAYIAQLDQMRSNAKRWLADHPGVDAKVQFNFQNKVGVIGQISEALKANFVSTNEQGLELLKAMWPQWDDPTEPTVLMVKAVMESL